MSEAFRLNDIKFDRLILLRIMFIFILILTSTLSLRCGRNLRIRLPTKCPCYSGTGVGATIFCQDPEDPLRLGQLIFLNRDDDIMVWFLIINGHDPLALMVLESRAKDGHNMDKTPEPPNRRYPIFDVDLRHEWAGAEDTAWQMQGKDEWINVDAWLQTEQDGATGVPPGAGVIVLDDGDPNI